ncbi:MAG TPA: AsmA family protein [Phenylobacterium sp.]|uniref:AsmA family protein n=1 Tax=Phenylobacterium sp. TaxID=1871053 RepID=UPI002D48673E|nr:AsmA family protein [Phenylobacterium sp.]HZZ67958.1 AsmA family protein [Phenylobacterium sp.]
MTTDTAMTPQDSGRDAAAKPARRRPSRRALAWTGGIFLTLAIAVAILAAIWDWNWFRGPIASIASGRMHRQVTIAGDLRVHLWSWQPSATADGVHIANPAWASPNPAGGADLADIDRIAVKIRLMALFTGHLDMRLLEFDRPRVALYRDADGRATWDFSDGAKPDEPLRLPPIRKFVIDDGKLNYRDDQRKLTFTGTVEAKERLGAANHGFQMTGQGVLNAQPFNLQVTGGPLLNIDRNKPYPFNADIHAGQTYVTAQGAVPKPFDLAQFYMNVTGRGPDLADLYGLTGVPLPNTPPYNLRARLSRDVHLWKLDGVAGKVGSSDLAGTISVKTGGRRPFLTADLRSHNLDFPDLGALFGGARKTGPVASPQQKAVAHTMQTQARIFPDATLDFTRIRAIDADVRFKADAITGAPIPLRSGSTRVKLDAGLLRADPVDLNLPQGRVQGFVQLNGRGANAVTDLDLRLANARLENLLPVRFQGSAPFTGAVAARAKLHGTGDSVHDAMGDANGEVMIVAPNGEIRQSLAELSGVDLIKGLGLLWSKDQATTPIRCGVLHFTGRGGVLSADRLVIDTGPVLIDGGGVINLDKETLGFTVRGHPKKFQLVRLLVPITVSGPILSPKVTIHKGQAIAQAGVAAALSVLSPAAILLPFVDAGLAKNADCESLVAQGKARGAPVSPATTARTPTKTSR